MPAEFEPESGLDALLNGGFGGSGSGDIDVVEYLNTHFDTVESLDNVDSVIQQLDGQI